MPHVPATRKVKLKESTPDIHGKKKKKIFEIWIMREVGWEKAFAKVEKAKNLRKSGGCFMKSLTKVLLR